MNKSMQKLQAISNYPEILNRNDIFSQQQKKRNMNSRSQSRKNLNSKSHQVSGVGFNFSSQNDMRSTVTSQKEQTNASKMEEGEHVHNDNNENKQTLQDEQNEFGDRTRNINQSQPHSQYNKPSGVISSHLNKNPLKKLFTPTSMQHNQQINNFYFASNRNTPKSNKDKRDFFQNTKSKSTIGSLNVLRRPSDVSYKFNLQRPTDGINSPLSNEMSTPKWFPNQFSNQLNTVNPSDSFYATKQSFDIVKNQNMKLQKNYEYIKDQVLQTLVLLEEEFRNSGKKDSDYKKPLEIVQSLVNLLSESAKNELKLALSHSQQQEKQEQISQLKATVESVQTQLHYIQAENRSLLSVKQENEKEILKMNRLLLQSEKKTKADKKMISQLEKRLELILETNFVEYANDRATGGSGLNSSTLKTSHPGTPVISSTQYQQIQTGTTSAATSQNLRILLSDLVKDNEQLKKDTLTLEIDILRLTENEQKLNKKIQTLNQKIENMKKKISAKDLEQLQQEEKQSQANQSQELLQQQNSSNLLKRLVIPSDADFRINSLKFEYSQILMELIEHGSNNFALHVSRNKNGEKRTKLISLMANQFISYRDFSNRFVQTVRLLHEFEQIDDLIKIQSKVSSQFPSLFKAETTRLWISDSITGVMYTYNQEQKKVNCFPGKGIFQDVIRGKLPINMKNQIANRYIYIQLNDTEDNHSIQLIQSAYQNSSQNYINLQSSQLTPFNSLTSFCLPIIIDEDVIGILEISDNSKSDGFGQDEELFGVVCANFLSTMIKKIKVEREQIIQIKYTDMLNSCFQKCLESESLLILEKKVHQQVQEMFGVEICKFYYVKEATQISATHQIQQPNSNEANFSSFYSLATNKAYSYKKGIIGEAITSMKPILINCLQTSSNYDPFVDVKTLLPAYTTPLFIKIEKDNTLECVGVLQIPLKKRTHIAREKDKFLLGATPLVGVDTTLENQIRHYSSLLAQAIKFIQQKDSSIQKK